MLLFYEDFTGVSEGEIGSQLTKEGDNNYWGVVQAGSIMLLWSDYVNIPYLDNVENSVVSNVIDMSDPQIISVNMSFNMAADTEPRVSDWTDYVILSVFKDNVWTEVGRYDETLFGDEAYHPVNVNLTNYASSGFKFKLTWITNGVNNEHLGVSIWTLQITAEVSSDIARIAATNRTAATNRIAATQR